MRRGISKAIAVVATAPLAALLPLTSASAAELQLHGSLTSASAAAPVDTRLHGPYSTKNACVNARIAVALSGRNTTPCAQTFRPATYDWFFWSSS